MLNETDRKLLSRKPKNFWTVSEVEQERKRLDGALNDQETYGLFVCGATGSSSLVEPDNFPRSSPVMVYTAGDTWKAMESRDYSYGLVMRYDNTLWAWGNNSNGQLAQNDTISRRFFIRIPGLWTSFSAGNSFGAGIDVGNNLYVWGYNGYGQLGQNDRANRSTPTQIEGKWKYVKCGENTLYAVNTNDDMYVIGRNDNLGQLGLPDKINRSSPTILPGKWGTLISCGDSHTMALKRNGSLWLWGHNNYGQLGQGDSIPRSSPVPAPLSGWTAISAGSNVSGGVIAGGDGGGSALFTWGYGANGNLGHGDVRSRSNPAQVFVYRSSPNWSSNINMENFQGERIGWHSLSCSNTATTFIDNGGGMWYAGYNGSGMMPSNNYYKNSPNAWVNTYRSSPVFVGTRFATNYEDPEQTQAKQPSSIWMGLRDVTYRRAAGY